MAENLERYGITSDDETTVHTTTATPVGKVRHQSLRTTTTPVGKARTWAGLEAREWIFLVVSLLNILATMGLTIYRLVVVVAVEHDEQSPDFTFAILLLINAAFCIFYVIHGLLRERDVELYALVAAIVVVVGYCIVEYAVNPEGRKLIKLVRLVLACILAPVNIVLAVLVARSFGWLEFRTVGPSRTMHDLYTRTSIFSCILKFDLQVSASFVVLVLQDGAKTSVPEIVTLAVGLPFCIAWCLWGWVAVHKEQKWMVWVFTIFAVAQPTYVIYKFVTVYDSIKGDTDAQKNMSIMALVYSQLTAGALAIIVRCLVIFELIRVSRNFGRGLKEREFPPEATERTPLVPGTR